MRVALQTLTLVFIELPCFVVGYIVHAAAYGLASGARLYDEHAKYVTDEATKP